MNVAGAVVDPKATVVPDAVQTIEDVPALKVKPVVKLFARALAPLNVTVDDPRLIVRVLELLEFICVAVTLKLLVVKVPLITKIAADDVKAS